MLTLLWQSLGWICPPQTICILVIIIIIMTFIIIIVTLSLMKKVETYVLMLAWARLLNSIWISSWAVVVNTRTTLLSHIISVILLLLNFCMSAFVPWLLQKEACQMIVVSCCYSIATVVLTLLCCWMNTWKSRTVEDVNIIVLWSWLRWWMEVNNLTEDAQN